MQKLRAIIGYFEKSTQATTKLLDFQRNSGIKEYKDQHMPKKLLQDVITRWWSTFRTLWRARFLKKAILGLLAAEEVSCESMTPNEWSILHQIEIVLETMAHFQRVLEGEYYVTASLVPVAVFQIRKGYQSVIDNNETLEEVRALAKILLADFDKRYHPASTNGKLAYSNVASVGFGNRYTTVHHYFFVAAFLDPRTKPLLREMMTYQHFSQLKNDVLNIMIAKAEQNKEIQGENEEKQTAKRPGTETFSTPTAASDRMARMFYGLNTMSAEQDEDADEDEDDEMMRNICYAEFQRYKNVSIALHNTDGSFNDPLAWWKKNSTKFPLLATLAREYLAIPATSAPSERIWSRASRVLSLKRASLKPEVA